MKIIFRVVAVILFIVFFNFALKNSDEANLHIFLNYDVKMPLVLLLLLFFTVGAVLAVLAMTPSVFRYKRELARLKKSMLAMQKETDAQRRARAQPPQPDSVVNQ